jgi:hypothetical protein
VPATGKYPDVRPESVTFVKLPVEGVVLPMAVLSMVPPVIAAEAGFTGVYPASVGIVAHVGVPFAEIATVA